MLLTLLSPLCCVEESVVGEGRELTVLVARPALDHCRRAGAGDA